MEDVFKGKLTLEVNDKEAKAVLVFTAAHDGETWTKGKVLSLLRDKRILDSVNPQALERALRVFAIKQDGTAAITIADNIPPRPIAQGSILWEDNPIPEAIAEAVQNKIDAAGAPEVYEWRYDKAAPGKAGDTAAKGTGKGKETILSKTPKEAAGEGAKIGYVKARGLVATLLSPKPESAGQNVGGEPIHQKESPLPELFYSEGFFLQENKLFAQEKGILRIGENWVELIPFTETAFRLTTSEDGSDCLLSYTPTSENRSAFSANDVIRAALALGFSENALISTESMSALLQEAYDKGIPLQDYSLCRPVDAASAISISSDKLSAFLTLKKHRGRGKPLILSEVAKTIRGSLISPLDIPRIRADILAFNNDPKQHDLNEYQLAQGTPSIKGESGSLTWEISFLNPEKKQVLLPRLLQTTDAQQILPSLEEFPVSEVKELALVNPEEKIAQLIPAKRGQPGRDVFGKQIPGLPGNDIEIKAFENVKKSGLNFVSEIRGLFEYGKKGAVWYLRVRPHQDASCSVELADDNMRAFLSIIPHQGNGEPISLPKAANTLKEKGVVAGIKQKVFNEAVALARNGKEIKRLLIAEGQPPLHADGERLIVLVQKQDKKRVRILSDGRADFKSLSNITVVRQGDLVAEITPPLSEAKDGQDVLGKQVSARTKSGREIPPLLNLRKVQAERGIVRLYAEADGEFVHTPAAIGVRQMHVISGDVGLATGNIRFPGSVLIKGSVAAGFSVFSKGDITVENMVEEALLSAEGSIVIHQGVKGSKKGVLRAKASIECLFAENTALLAVGDISLERSCLNCTIKCNGKLIVGRTKGTLMGGIAQAKKGMVLVNLGSPSEVKTSISFGQDYLLGDQIRAEEKELEKVKQKALEVDRVMVNLQRDPAKIITLREEKVKLLKIADQLSMRIFTMRERFEEHFPGEIVVRGTIYPGVVIESHGRLFTVKTEKTGARFTFNHATGQIEESFVHSPKDRPVQKIKK